MFRPDFRTAIVVIIILPILQKLSVHVTELVTITGQFVKVNAKTNLEDKNLVHFIRRNIIIIESVILTIAIFFMFKLI